MASINRRQKETEAGQKNKGMLIILGEHHRRSDVGCLCVPKKGGGRGLMQIEGACIADVMKLVEYVESKADPLIQVVRTHQHHTNSTLLQIVEDFKNYFQSGTKQIRAT
jgi:hypothetical protein